MRAGSGDAGVTPLETTDPTLALEELFSRSRQLAIDTIDALDRGEDSRALDLIPDLLRSYGWLWVALADARRALEAEEGEMLAQVLAAIGRRVRLAGDGAAPAAERAELCWQVPVLMERLRSRGSTLPHWVAPLEAKLTQIGSQLWVDRHRADPGCAEARPRALTLLLRLCALHQPPKPWMVRFARELLLEAVAAGESAAAAGPLEEDSRDQLHQWAAQMAQVEPLEHGLSGRLAALLEPAAAVGADTQALPPGGGEGEPPDPDELEARIRQSVAHWLDENPPGRVPAELRLVCVPGARVVPHDGQRLDLNLAPLLSLEDQIQRDRLVGAFFEPIREQQRGSGFTLREPTSSLYEALGLLWRQGDTLSRETFRRMVEATATWNRCGGPGALGSRPLASSSAVAELREGRSVLAPQALELAALQAVLFEAGSLEEVMAAIRRHHLDPDWMGRRGEPGSGSGGAVEETLRRLHTEAGFYASGHAPLETLQHWSQRVLQALLGGQVAGSAASTGFYPVAQKLYGSTGRVPELLQWPPDPAIYRFLAGKEVVAATTLAAQVEEQHRSGRAFRLFSDLPIAPYGLRCVQAPLSRYPERPAGDFVASLEACLERIEGLHRERPFQVFVAACGCYGLPLCEAVQRLYGVTCLCSGETMHRYFGVEQAGQDEWRGETRISENWLSVAP